MVIAKYIDDGSRSEAVVSIVLSMCVVNHLDVVEQNLCRTDPGAGTAFAEGFDIPTDEVYQFLALREVAHARLFKTVSEYRSEIRKCQLP